MEVSDVEQAPARGRRRRILGRPAMLAAVVACGLALAGVFASSAAAGGGCWCTGSGGGAFLSVEAWGFDGSAWGYGEFAASGFLTGTFDTRHTGDGGFTEEGQALVVYATDEVWGTGQFTGNIPGYGSVYGADFRFSGTFNETGYSGSEVITSTDSPVPFRIYLTETNGVIFYTVSYHCGGDSAPIG